MRGVAPGEPMHGMAELVGRILEEQVDVVAHEAPGKHVNPGIAQAFPREQKEEPPVAVALEYDLAPAAAQDDMIEALLGTNSGTSRHNCLLTAWEEG